MLNIREYLVYPRWEDKIYKYLPGALVVKYLILFLATVSMVFFVNTTETSNDLLEKSVTFFAVGDLHIGKPLPTLKGGAKDNGQLIFSLNQMQVQAMNRALDDTVFRSDLSRAEISPDVTGLIVAGDFTDNGEDLQLRQFENIYGLSAKEATWNTSTGKYTLSLPTSDTRLGLRVFESGGNHDFPWRTVNSIYTSIDEVSALKRIRRRNMDSSNRGYRADRLILSPNKAHYAIKYPGVNLIVVHLGAKVSNRKNEVIETEDNCEDDDHSHSESEVTQKKYRNVHSFDSLTFLESVIANHTSSVGGPTRLIINTHYPIFINRYNSFEKNQLYQVLHKNRKTAKVIAMVSAHRHKTAAHNWCGIPVIEGGSPLQITDGLTSKGLDPYTDATFAAINVTADILRVNTIAWNLAEEVKVSSPKQACNLKKATNNCFEIKKWISNIRLDDASSCATSSPTLWGQLNTD